MTKVIWISSYLPRSCGIAYYSADYISALEKYDRRKKKKLSIKIVAHTDASKADYSVINQRDREWHYRVFEIIKKEKPDIVHIQHEYGLYETYSDKNKRVIKLIELVRGINIPVVMTFHSVYKKLNRDFSEFMSTALKKLNAGILHEKYQKDNLKNNLGWEPKNVFILPHGSRDDLKINREEIRRALGYSDKDLVVGTAGLADERKGFRTLIKQWPKVIKKFPNAILSIELKPHKSEITKKYIIQVQKEILKSKTYKKIELVVRDYSEEEFFSRLASFDVLVLAYKSESQSGVLAHGFAVGVPAIVTDIEGLGAEIRNSGAGIAVKKRSDFYKAIIKMLSSKKLRGRYSKNALKYVKNVNGWSIIAKKTLEIYEKIKEKNGSNHRKK